MVTDLVKLQHQQIRKALQELQEDVYNEEEVKENQLWIALRIGTLTGILLMHLKYEDEYLYPVLLQHPKEEVRKMSERYIKEMGNLSEVFENYKAKYLKEPNSIKENSSQFIADTNAILYAISKRVEKEEHELFPLVG
ncbi:MAG TPA: hemerythrin domain-containing protein [Peptococcaceae bacterium]|nr:hemerythrin domain-containing protein [Peptococcaceae bacterium]